MVRHFGATFNFYCHTHVFWPTLSILSDIPSRADASSSTRLPGTQRAAWTLHAGAHQGANLQGKRPQSAKAASPGVTLADGPSLPRPAGEA